MEQRLAEVLNGTTENYILPFLWLRGESEDVLVEEVEKIHQSGIGAFCVESRPHNDFCGPGWWHDMDILLREAKKRDMKVWILDDKHYPTGNANDSLGRHPKARPWLLAEQHLDVAGPFHGACLLASKGETFQDEEHRLFKVLAYPRTGAGEAMTAEPIDLTDHVKGDLLYWDVPEGCFRIVMLFVTRRGEMPGHISMIDKDSVKILIDEVYEPHYRQYKEEFGKTITGFFSDEPGFFNQMLEGSTGFYEHKVGTPGLALPWRLDMLERLEGKLGYDATELLAALWFDLGDVTAEVRVAYMDIISGLYRDCFTRQLGNWCREHGVQYIGHVVEDNNCHARLFQGAGHYFRALDGQDMAGVDVVLHQLLPGFGGVSHTSSAGLADSEFFDFVLAKLGGSLANLNGRMQGRAMCELYGAYGWAEGLPVMKWMTDHMLVRGINHFVPHAFSPAYPDGDCPPHFYGRGHNPWFEDFQVLMEYTNKMSHLLSGGQPQVPAAVLYHAEAEWSGGKYMYMQVPCRALAEHQIDYHIVPGERLAKAACVDGRLRIGTMTYQCLIVPECEILPEQFLASMERLMEEGVPVYFVNGIPKRGVLGEGRFQGCQGSERTDIARICTPENLPEQLWAEDCYDIRVRPVSPFLRYCHTVRNGSHIYMFFNEGMTQLTAEVKFPLEGSCTLVDLMGKRCYDRTLEEGALNLNLESYESVVVVFEPVEESAAEEPSIAESIRTEGESAEESISQQADRREETNRDQAAEETLSTFRIELQETGKEAFTVYKEESILFDITGPEGIPDFSGKIRYLTSFEGKQEYTVLELGEVGETATVILNGKTLGTRICRPYRFNMAGAIQEGENLLEIQIINSPAYYEQDGLSKRMMLTASGLLGPVKIRKRKKEEPK